MDPAIRYSKWLDAQDKKKSKKDAFDEQNTEDAAGKKTNPFQGQKIKKNGKWVDRTPSNSPGGKP